MPKTCGFSASHAVVSRGPTVRGDPATRAPSDERGAHSPELAVIGFGPIAGDQRSLLAEPAAIRRARLREAVRQARSVAGPDAALRIIPVDPDSRVPERRLTLAPWDP